MPKNGATGRSYSGINVLILWGAVIEHGFPAQGWVTFRQALALGGNVRKGEQGTTVVYADRFIPDDEKRRARRESLSAPVAETIRWLPPFRRSPCRRRATSPSTSSFSPSRMSGA
jgi:antirestriction protein ArdC